MKIHNKSATSKFAHSVLVSAAILGSIPFVGIADLTTTVKAQSTEYNAAINTGDEYVYNIPDVWNDDLNELPASWVSGDYHVSIPMNEFPVYGAVITSSGSEEPLVHTVFNARHYTAWCLDYNRLTPNSSTYSIEKQNITDSNYHVLVNGYPFKSLDMLGLDNIAEGLAATQEAVWEQSGNTDFRIDNVDINNDNTWGLGKPSMLYERQKVKMAAQEIMDQAQHDTRTQDKPSITNLAQAPEIPTNITSGSSGSATGHDNNGYWTVTADPQGQGSIDPKGNITYTYLPNITNGYKAVNSIFKSITGPKGMIVKQGKHQIRPGDKCQMGVPYQVIIPASATKAEREAGFKIDLETDTNGWLRANGYVNSDGKQNSIVQDTGRSSLFKPAYSNRKVDIQETLGEIHLHKVGEEGESLAGNIFDLIDADTGKLVQEGKTDKDGNIVFTKLPHGNYIIREVNSDVDHDLNFHDQHVTLTDDEIISHDYPTANFQNTEIKDKPILESYATEQETTATGTHGSRLVDAKYEDIQDEILINNLDPHHSYRVVDTLYNRTTNEPLKLKDGSIAQEEETFTAKDPDPKLGHDRGYYKVTLKYPQVDLHGLQDQNIYAKAKIYRVANSQVPTHDGDLLAVEDTNNNLNQTLHVQKPVINTIATGNPDGTTHLDGKIPNGNKVVNPYSQTKINDWANIRNLVKGHKYIAHLKMMTKDRKTGEVKPYIDPKTNKPVTTTKEFTATNEVMNISTDFPDFSTVDQQGQELTVYYDVAPIEEDDDHLAEHYDINDTDETIRVTTPVIHTKALIDDDKVSNPSKVSVLKDRVKVDDVAPNQPLELGAIASNDKSKAITLNVDNKKYWIMGKIKFTPKGSSSIQDVPLEMVNATAANKVGNSGSPTTGDGTDNTGDVSDVNIEKAAVRQKMNGLKSQTTDQIIQKPVEAGEYAGGSDRKNPYLIDTTSIAGQSMTMFEDLWEVPDLPMASHADVNDKDQTVRVTNPKLHTEALLNDHHVSNPSSKSHLRDEIKYEDVAPGHMLDFDALMVHPENGNPIVVYEGKDNEKAWNLMGKTRIYPKAPNGETTVPLQKVTATKESLEADKSKDKKDNSSTTNPSATDNDTNTVPNENHTDGKGVSKLLVKLDKNSSEAQIRQNIDLIEKYYTKQYKVDTSALDKALSISDKPMSDASKNDVLTEYNKVMDKLLQSMGDNASDLLIYTKITKEDKDADIKAAVSDLDKIAEHYGLDHDKIDNDIQVAKDPMLDSDKSTIVSAYDNLVQQIKDQLAKQDANNAAQNGADAEVGANTTPHYTTDLSGTKKAEERIANNLILAKDPKVDDSKEDINGSKYDIDTMKLRNVRMVAIEDMVNPDYSGNKKDNVITSEVDVNNTNQQVRVTNPQIHTMQTIANKKNYVIEGKGKNDKQPIVDEVEYKDFAPDEKINLSAVEMDSGTKRPVLVNGQYLYGRTIFTPEEQEGSVNVNFNLLTREPSYKYIAKMLNTDGTMITTLDTSEDTSQSQSKGVNSPKGTVNEQENQDTKAYDIPMETLAQNLQNAADGDKLSWAAYETAENGKDIVAEHKDATDTDQIITITHKEDKKKNKKPKKNIIKQKQKQKQNNGDNKNTNNINIPGGGSKGSGSDSNGGSTPNSGGTAPGGASGGYAQTGGTNKLSHNAFYNFVYKWFNRK